VRSNPVSEGSKAFGPNIKLYERKLSVMTKDMTTGKIMPLLVKFTIPLVLGNLFQLTYNAVDSIIVGHFVAGLKEKLGENLWVIAEGERKERLEREGLWINGQQFFPCVKAPEEAVGADLILVSVKYGGLEKILPWIETMTDSHTVVMSLLNGVDSEEIIGKRIGMEHMVYSLMKIASQRTGNQIRYDPEKTAGVFFGEKDCCVSERVKALCRLLDGSGVHYRVCQNVMQDLWYKFSLNISKNLPQAIQAFVTSTQEYVTGEVKFKLYKGNIIKAGTTSPYSLYSESLASITKSSKQKIVCQEKDL
jgi:hypothetical protein